MYIMFRYTRVLLWLGMLACFMLRPAHASEMRAFWCDAWGKGFKTPAQTEQLVDFAAKYGFNAVFVEVRKRGDAYYNSSIEPRGAELPEGYDPLADILARAHKKGIMAEWLMANGSWLMRERTPACRRFGTTSPAFPFRIADFGMRIVRSINHFGLRISECGLLAASTISHAS
jgi:hypothetical protein